MSGVSDTAEGKHPLDRLNKSYKDHGSAAGGNNHLYPGVEWHYG